VNACSRGLPPIAVWIARDALRLHRNGPVTITVTGAVFTPKDMYAFGNDPAKVARYQAFWNWAPAARPLVGFSIKSWFPLQEFAASAAWQTCEWLTPDMVDAQQFLADQERLLREGEVIDDDILRGASPSQAVPWLDGMLGAALQILPGSILGVERTLAWEQLEQLRLDVNHVWFRKYIEFIEALVRHAAGRYPVSHSPLIGPSDMAAVLRGHTQSVLDLLEAPDKMGHLLQRCGEIFAQVTEEAWKHIPRFCGGYFDAQYQLWSPGPLVRLQEDAAGVFSPRTYRNLLQPVDRAVAARFPSAFIHLHSNSMFLYDAFLELEEIRCFQVNYEISSGGPPIAGMVPAFRKIQAAHRPLLVRGSFTPDELRLLVDALDPAGLYLYIMVGSLAEVQTLRPILGM